MARTIRSENQYEKKFIAAARPRAMMTPPRPPSAPPSTRISAVRRPRKNAVLIVFIETDSCHPARGIRADTSAAGPRSPADGTAPPPDGLLHLDADRRGARFGLLGQDDLEDAVALRRADSRLVDVRRQAEGAHERSVRTLGAMVVLGADVARGAAIAAQRQGVVVDPDLDLPLLHAGQIRAQHDAVRVLEDVDGGRPLAGADLLLPLLPRHRLLEQAVHAFLDRQEIPERIPACRRHRFFPRRPVTVLPPAATAGSAASPLVAVLLAMAASKATSPVASFQSARTRAPGTLLPSRTRCASGSSTSRCSVRLRGRAPYSGSYPISARCARRRGVISSAEPRDASMAPRRAALMSTTRARSSVDRERKITTSSMRFRNSGRKCALSSRSTSARRRVLSEPCQPRIRGPARF